MALLLRCVFDLREKILRTNTSTLRNNFIVTRIMEKKTLSWRRLKRTNTSGSSSNTKEKVKFYVKLIHRITEDVWPFAIGGLVRVLESAQCLHVEYSITSRCLLPQNVSPVSFFRCNSKYSVFEHRHDINSWKNALETSPKSRTAYSWRWVLVECDVRRNLHE